LRFTATNLDGESGLGHVLLETHAGGARFRGRRTDRGTHNGPTFQQ
jgi:hypothetical protein